MSFRANEVATEQRANAKTVRFNVTIVPTGAGTYAAAFQNADDLASAGAVVSGTVGSKTDATVLAPNGTTKISFELKDGYAQRFVAARGEVKASTGGAATVATQGVCIAGQVTPSGHVAGDIQFSASVGAAAGTTTLVIEVTYE